MTTARECTPRERRSSSSLSCRALVWPVSTAVSLVLLWGVFALVDGVVAIVGLIARGVLEIVDGIGRRGSARWWLVGGGVQG